MVAFCRTEPIFVRTTIAADKRSPDRNRLQKIGHFNPIRRVPNNSSIHREPSLTPVVVKVEWMSTHDPSCFHSSRTGWEICPICIPRLHGQISQPHFPTLFRVGLSLSRMPVAKADQDKKMART